MGNDERAQLDRPWARTLPARAVRELIICGVLDPIIRCYAHREVRGHEQLARLDGPAIFVANHGSHADTPVLLRALPGRWRRRTAVAAAVDYFYTRPLLAAAVSLAFGTVPVQRHGGGAGTTVLERLVRDGWSVVVFAEGTRSRDGRVGPLRTGAAVLAAAQRVPLVPVHIAGTRIAMPIGARWMRRPAGDRLARHALSVRFGPPIHVRRTGDRFEAMERVRQFLASCGAQTTPDPKLAARRRAAVARARRTAGGQPV
jgi:1-acyl-sn-glycerol-3-phosphate acyltransferase